jgi:hypothetical protein
MPSDSSDKKESLPKGDRRGLGTTDSSVARPRRGSITLADLPKFLSRRNTLTDLPKFHSRRNIEYGEPGSPDSETVESKIVSLDSEEGMPPSCSTAMRKSISSCRDSIDAELHRLSYNF